MDWFTDLSVSNKIALITLVFTCLGVIPAYISLTKNGSKDTGSSISISKSNLGNNNNIINSPDGKVSIFPQKTDIHNLRRVFIEPQKVGFIEIGDSIDITNLPEGFRISDDGISSRRQTGEGRVVETLSVLSYKDMEVYEILWDFDYEKEQYIRKVGEIMINSDIPQTIDRIKVGSTLTDLGGVYELDIWYSYVGDIFVATTEELPGVQFLLERTGYVGQKNLYSSDMVELEFYDFKSDTVIRAIRVF